MSDPFWWHTLPHSINPKAPKLHLFALILCLRMESISRFSPQTSHLDNDEKPQIMDHNDSDVEENLDSDTLFVQYLMLYCATEDSGNTSDKTDLSGTYVERLEENKQVEDPTRKVPKQHISGLDLPAPAVWLRSRSPRPNHRAEVRRSFITTTVRDESQVTPQGRHR